MTPLLLPTHSRVTPVRKARPRDLPEQKNYFILCWVFFVFFTKTLSRRLPSIPPQDVWKQDEGAGEGALPQDLQRVGAQAAAQGDERVRGESSEEHPAAWGPGDLTKKTLPSRDQAVTVAFFCFRNVWGQTAASAPEGRAHMLNMGDVTTCIEVIISLNFDGFRLLRAECS